VAGGRRVFSACTFVIRIVVPHRRISQCTPSRHPNQGNRLVEKLSVPHAWWHALCAADSFDAGARLGWRGNHQRTRVIVPLVRHIEVMTRANEPAVLNLS
jgi:hypothetical protein